MVIKRDFKKALEILFHIDLWIGLIFHLVLIKSQNATKIEYLKVIIYGDKICTFSRLNHLESGLENFQYKTFV